MQTKMRPRQGSSHDAYTLVEVVVGLGLLVIMVGALYTGITFGMRRTSLVHEELRATQILTEKLEAVRLYTWDKILYGVDPDDPEDWTDPFDSTDPHLAEDEPPPFLIPTTFTVPIVAGDTNPNAPMFQGTLIITNSSYTEDYAKELKEVIVRLEWESQGRKRTREARTLFARYGMQNNIRR